MKQTYYQPFDFLDLDPTRPGTEFIWKAGRPTDAMQDGTDVVLQIPFHRHLGGRDLAPDESGTAEDYRLRIRAYGDKILRISIDFDGPPMRDSEMLAMDPDLVPEVLTLQKKPEVWQVADASGTVRARLNLRDPETDHWSDLVPPSPFSPELSFFPDAHREISFSAYDQFFPARQDAFPLAWVEKNGSCDRATMSFRAEPDEMFAGTGERFGKMDLSGQTVQLKNMDAQGVNSRRTYKNIPFFISSRMYGVFMHTSAYGKISLADHSTRSIQLLVEENLLDVFLIGGDSPEEILRMYRRLTGFPAMPPAWSFGTWMSRMSYFSAEEVNRVCERMREEGFPADVIHLDTGWFRKDWLCEWTFNRERFPDPPAFIAGLKKNGFRVSLWQMPYIAAEAEQHEEALKKNYIGKRGAGRMKSGSDFSAMDYEGTIDFTNPEAVKWYRGLLKNLLDMGVACIKTDFGEDIHMDAEYHGMEASRLNNLYALLYQKTAFEVTREVTGQGIVWARAGWAGCQRYPVHWGGDAACTWDGMAGSLKGGLHLGLSGFGFWSHDVPGFHGLPDFMNAVIPDELYVRWTQFGVFTSHLRYHGTSKREPWHFRSVAGIVRKWLRLRYALLPYILDQAEKVTRTGYPMLRALVFHHPGDRQCWTIHDQYYFGDEFLVAPVMNSLNRRDVYLPEGDWVNLFTGEKLSGGRWIKDLQVPLEELPVWARPGAKIPVFPEKIDCTDEYNPGRVKMLVLDKGYKGIYSSCLGALLNESEH